MTQRFQLLCLSHSGIVDSGHYNMDNVQEVNYCINIPSSGIFRCYLNLQRWQCEEEANIFPGKIRRITRIIKPGIMKKLFWRVCAWKIGTCLVEDQSYHHRITHHFLLLIIRLIQRPCKPYPHAIIHAILYGNEGGSSQYSDTDHYVTDIIIGELLDSIFNKLPAFIHQLEIQTY